MYLRKVLNVMDKYDYQEKINKIKAMDREKSSARRIASAAKESKRQYLKNKERYGVMKSKYETVCSDCQEPISVGQWIVYDGKPHHVACCECHHPMKDSEGLCWDCGELIQ
jgi:hypothetical protein